jgi:hypothetical protein
MKQHCAALQKEGKRNFKCLINEEKTTIEELDLLVYNAMCIPLKGN